MLQCLPALRQRTDLRCVLPMDSMCSMRLKTPAAVLDNVVGHGGDSKFMSSIKMDRYTHVQEFLLI